MNSLREKFRIAGSSFSPELKEEIFAEIWNEYYPRMTVYLRTSFRTYNTEDLVQDIMLKVYRKLETYNPFYSFNTWIYSIARNHAADCIRKNITTEKTVSVLKQSAEVQSGAGSQSPESLFLRAEMKTGIKHFMEQLPETDAQIVFLRYYEGMRLNTISRITGIPTGTIKSRQYTIRKKLEKYYGENYAD